MFRGSHPCDEATGEGSPAVQDEQNPFRRFGWGEYGNRSGQNCENDFTTNAATAATIAECHTEPQGDTQNVLDGFTWGAYASYHDDSEDDPQCRSSESHSRGHGMNQNESNNVASTAGCDPQNVMDGFTWGAYASYHDDSHHDPQCRSSDSRSPANTSNQNDPDNSAGIVGCRTESQGENQNVLEGFTWGAYASYHDDSEDDPQCRSSDSRSPARASKQNDSAGIVECQPQGENQNVLEGFTWGAYASYHDDSGDNPECPPAVETQNDKDYSDASDLSHLTEYGSRFEKGFSINDVSEDNITAPFCPFNESLGVDRLQSSQVYSDPLYRPLDSLLHFDPKILGGLPRKKRNRVCRPCIPGLPVPDYITNPRPPRSLAEIDDSLENLEKEMIRENPNLCFKNMHTSDVPVLYDTEIHNEGIVRLPDEFDYSELVDYGSRFEKEFSMNDVSDEDITTPFCPFNESVGPERLQSSQVYSEPLYRPLDSLLHFDPAILDGLPRLSKKPPLRPLIAGLPIPDYITNPKPPRSLREIDESLDNLETALKRENPKFCFRDLQTSDIAFFDDTEEMNEGMKEERILQNQSCPNTSFREKSRRMSLPSHLEGSQPSFHYRKSSTDPEYIEDADPDCSPISTSPHDQSEMNPFKRFGWGEYASQNRSEQNAFKRFGWGERSASELIPELEDRYAPYPEYGPRLNQEFSISEYSRDDIPSPICPFNKSLGIDRFQSTAIHQDPVDCSMDEMIYYRNQKHLLEGLPRKERRGYIGPMLGGDLPDCVLRPRKPKKSWKFDESMERLEQLLRKENPELFTPPPLSYSDRVQESKHDHLTEYGSRFEKGFSINDVSEENITAPFCPFNQSLGADRLQSSQVYSDPLYRPLDSLLHFDPAILGGLRRLPKQMPLRPLIAGLPIPDYITNPRPPRSLREIDASLDNLDAVLKRENLNYGFRDLQTSDIAFFDDTEEMNEGMKEERILRNQSCLLPESSINERTVHSSLPCRLSGPFSYPEPFEIERYPADPQSNWQQPSLSGKEMSESNAPLRQAVHQYEASHSSSYYEPDDTFLGYPAKVYGTPNYPAETSVCPNRTLKPKMSPSRAPCGQAVHQYEASHSSSYYEPDDTFLGSPAKVCGAPSYPAETSICLNRSVEPIMSPSRVPFRQAMHQYEASHSSSYYEQDDTFLASPAKICGALSYPESIITDSFPKQGHIQSAETSVCPMSPSRAPFRQAMHQYEASHSSSYYEPDDTFLKSPTKVCEAPNYPEVTSEAKMTESNAPFRQAMHQYEASHASSYYEQDDTFLASPAKQPGPSATTILPDAYEPSYVSGPLSCPKTDRSIAAQIKVMEARMMECKNKSAQGYEASHPSSYYAPDDTFLPTPPSSPDVQSVGSKWANNLPKLTCPEAYRSLHVSKAPAPNASLPARLSGKCVLPEPLNISQYPSDADEWALACNQANLKDVGHKTGPPRNLKKESRSGHRTLPTSLEGTCQRTELSDFPEATPCQKVGREDSFWESVSDTSYAPDDTFLASPVKPPVALTIHDAYEPSYVSGPLSCPKTDRSIAAQLKVMEARMMECKNKSAQCYESSHPSSYYAPDDTFLPTPPSSPEVQSVGSKWADDLPKLTSPEAYRSLHVSKASAPNASLPARLSGTCAHPEPFNISQYPSDADEWTCNQTKLKDLGHKTAPPHNIKKDTRSLRRTLPTVLEGTCQPPVAFQMPATTCADASRSERNEDSFWEAIYESSYAPDDTFLASPVKLLDPHPIRWDQKAFRSHSIPFKKSDLNRPSLPTRLTGVCSQPEPINISKYTGDSGESGLASVHTTPKRQGHNTCLKQKNVHTDQIRKTLPTRMEGSCPSPVSFDLPDVYATRKQDHSTLGQTDESDVSYQMQGSSVTESGNFIELDVKAHLYTSVTRYR